MRDYLGPGRGALAVDTPRLRGYYARDHVLSRAFLRGRLDPLGIRGKQG